MMAPLKQDMVLVLLLAIFCSMSIHTCNADPDTLQRPNWLINIPPEFERRRNNSNLRRFEVTDMHTDGKTPMLVHLGELLDERIKHVDAFTDGEFVDVMEHFFWGKRRGISMELGALDGTSRTKSQTVEMEDFEWKRILIDGNPKYRETMPKHSPHAYCVLGAICSSDGQGQDRKVHYHDKDYVGGILEFMGGDFLKDYHKEVFQAGNPPGDLSTVDWGSAALANLGIHPIDCIPLHVILKRAHVEHINFFILDVEGGEFEVLQSIQWAHTAFDVLCIETETVNRPAGYADKITKYLKDRGYVEYGYIGRNSWYIHKDFTPSIRPGMRKDCFNGARMSALADANWTKRRNDKFVSCKDLPAEVKVFDTEKKVN